MVKSTTLKVALFGGSFDPPHLGHQEIIKKALRVLDIDALLVLPAYHNPFKEESVADATQRLEMAQAVFGSFQGVIVDDFEIKNAIKYTIESLEHFQKSYDVAYIIIGADNLERLWQWKDFERLDSMITWVIAKRGERECDTSFLRSFRFLDIGIDISSTQIRENFELQYIDTKITKKVKRLYKKGKNKI
ncbi:MAG: nicotinate (nicotinamide) nucleotide adenylyltransferase [Campylobacterales bacterium]|nr:nicotinate (nicotinamide) nucleotide adenylyltransferase [Campylobacterales bacterium]